MSLGEKVRKLFLKLGLTYLPLLGFGTAAALAVKAYNADQIIVTNTDIENSDIEYGEKRVIIYHRNGLPALSILSGICALGTYGLYRARKRRRIIAPHKGIDKIFDYPGIISSTGAIATLGATLALSYLGKKEVLFDVAKREPGLATAFLASNFICFNYIYYLLADKISSLKSPCLKNYAKIFGLVFNTHEERQKKAIDIVAEETATTLSTRAEIAFNEGRKFDALYYYNASLQQLKRRSEFEEALATSFINSLTHKIVVLIDEIRINSCLKKDPGNIGLLTNKEYNSLIGSDEKGVREIAYKIISIPDCSDEDKLLQSFILDYLGEKAYAEPIRNSILRKLFMEKDIVKLGRGLIYRKSGLRERLDSEFQALSDLQIYCSRYDFEVARPLGIFGSGEDSALFETFSDGVSLFDYLEASGDIEALKKAAHTQAVLHGVMPRQGGFFLSEDISSFLSKVPESWAFDKNRLYDALYDILTPVVEFSAADCDGHRMNRHYNETHQITIYDIEPRGLVPIAFDYAKLLRQGRWIGSWHQQKELLAECADDYNRFAEPVGRLDADLLPELVLRSTTYKALRYASFAWNQPEKHKTALTFIDNVKKDAYMLENESLLDKRRLKDIANAVKTVNDALIGQSGHRPPMTSH